MPCFQPRGIFLPVLVTWYLSPTYSHPYAMSLNRSFPQPVRMQSIVLPLHWIPLDVLNNLLPFRFIPDDMLVIISLPDWRLLKPWQFPNKARGARFILSDHRTDRSWLRSFGAGGGEVAVRVSGWSGRPYITRVVLNTQIPAARIILESIQTGRPYDRGNQNDTVEMVGHHAEFIQSDLTELTSKLLPDSLHDSPGLVQAHLTSDHLAKQAFTLPGTQGNEISPCLCVIIPFEPD